MVGIANLFFAALLAFLTYFLADKIFAQATLNWAANTGVGAGIFLPLMVGFAITALMLLASLFIIYKDDARREEVRRVSRLIFESPSEFAGSAGRAFHRVVLCR